jgi:hypothetical protein
MPRIGARFGCAAGFAVFALIVTAIALGYFAQSIFLLFEAHAFSPSAAAALTGACAMGLAAIFGIFGRLVLRPKPAARPAPVARANGVANGIAADLGALAAQQIVNATREHPYGTMGAALAAGLAVGAIPELRKTLTDLLKH